MENIKPNLMESIWMLEYYQIQYFITPVQKSVQLFWASLKINAFWPEIYTELEIVYISNKNYF